MLPPSLAFRGVTESYVMEGGTEKKRLFVKGMRAAQTYLFVAKMVWGKDGAADQWIPYFVEDDLKLPETHGRIFTEPFDKPFVFDFDITRQLFFPSGTPTTRAVPARYDARNSDHPSNRSIAYSSRPNWLHRHATWPHGPLRN